VNDAPPDPVCSRARRQRLFARPDRRDPAGWQLIASVAQRDGSDWQTAPLTTFTSYPACSCGNSDCDGCCTRSSHGGFLVDMEYWTTQRRLGGPDDAAGTVQFRIWP
jgi:hypothetical protein